jgi:hypothetical protein
MRASHRLWPTATIRFVILIGSRHFFGIWVASVETVAFLNGDWLLHASWVACLSVRPAPVKQKRGVIGFERRWLAAAHLLLCLIPETSP